MKNNLLIMDKKDNVAIAIKKIKKNEIAFLEKIQIKSLDDIPESHKIALKDIHLGDEIIRYGYPIGYATTNIKKGEWVHIHNLDAEKIMK